MPKRPIPTEPPAAANPREPLVPLVPRRGTEATIALRARKAGIHEDRRTKRRRTRAAADKAALAAEA